MKSVRNFSGIFWWFSNTIGYVILRLFVVFDLPISNSPHLYLKLSKSLHSQQSNPKAEMIKVRKKVVANINFIIHKCFFNLRFTYDLLMICL